MLFSFVTAYLTMLGLFMATARGAPTPIDSLRHSNTLNTHATSNVVARGAAIPHLTQRSSVVQHNGRTINGPFECRISLRRSAGRPPSEGEVLTPEAAGVPKEIMACLERLLFVELHFEGARADTEFVWLSRWPQHESEKVEITLQAFSYEENRLVPASGSITRTFGPPEEVV
ncbi:hypothetical protein F5880DRAFT_654848 [Lentinula raphanica]|nr:hypothetical protein F5880DRAFT_654848 [Lentinula raphanica]